MNSPLRNNFCSFDCRRRLDDVDETESDESNESVANDVDVAHVRGEVDARLGGRRMRRRIPQRRFDFPPKIFCQVVAEVLVQPVPAELGHVTIVPWKVEIVRCGWLGPALTKWMVEQ